MSEAVCPFDSRLRMDVETEIPGAPQWCRWCAADPTCPVDAHPLRNWPKPPPLEDVMAPDWDIDMILEEIERRVAIDLRIVAENQAALVAGSGLPTIVEEGVE